jgi:RimJ/RimL family protein N-acetyltransferase
MFARTTRLTLRPLWPEDAPALAAAIGHEAVIRNLARVPLPYTVADAEAFAGTPRSGEEPVFAILSHETADGTPRLVGGIGLHDAEDGVQLGYWLTPNAWGRGYATEAGRAVIGMARHALPLAEVRAWHFADNPASGRVLAKLGFRATGETRPRASVGRSALVPSVAYALDLEDAAVPMRQAA